MVTDGFNELEDVTCNFTEGAMYSFPQVRSSLTAYHHCRKYYTFLAVQGAMIFQDVTSNFTDALLLFAHPI
jgi:hypothetical protein